MALRFALWLLAGDGGEDGWETRDRERAKRRAGDANISRYAFRHSDVRVRHFSKSKAMHGDSDPLRSPVLTVASLSIVGRL